MFLLSHQGRWILPAPIITILQYHSITIPNIGIDPNIHDSAVLTAPIRRLAPPTARKCGQPRSYDDSSKPSTLISSNIGISRLISQGTISVAH